jgi:hypothetical protein
VVNILIPEAIDTTANKETAGIPAPPVVGMTVWSQLVYIGAAGIEFQLRLRLHRWEEESIKPAPGANQTSRYRMGY